MTKHFKNRIRTEHPNVGSAACFFDCFMMVRYDWMMSSIHDVIECGFLLPHSFTHELKLDKTHSLIAIT